MNKFLKKLFPDNDSKFINKSNQILSLINEEESNLSELTDDEVKSMSLELKSTAKNIDDSILIKSFSIVREASKRVLGMRHFDVQIIGGLALNEGKISEMKTGEGKTLVATLPAYLNAICNQKVHVVTVNDYLAKRDASWMGKVFDFLGLSIGFLQNNDAYVLLFDEDGTPKTIQSERKKVYECDIVYGTNSEFGFDYLRDNMIYDISQKVQPGLDFTFI